MKPVRILVETLVDQELTNAQMTNGRDIIARLDPARFHVTTFVLSTPDPDISRRPNTRLIRLPNRYQTIKILLEFIFGNHEILFYVKASPASRWYVKLKSARKDGRVTIGTLESQSNLRAEPTITRENIRLWEQTVLRCDYLFSNSNAVKRSLESEYGIASEVVPTGVDTNFFTPDWHRVANARPLVLFVGSLRHFKGAHIVLNAAECFPQADFVLVGDGRMADELRARAQHLTNVRFDGALSRTAVRDKYRQSDIFLFPSRWEGSPKVIMEAAACGLPVIARKDYQPETVVDGETGYLVAGDDELFSRLEELLTCPAQRRDMGQAARAHIAKFDWDRITRQWEKIFLHLAARTNGGGH